MTENAGEKHLIFTIQDRRYALPSKIINEVEVLEKVFPLPLVPEYVRGFINRYSIPYALIDTDFLLSGSLSEAQKVIVLKQEIDTLALLIDDVTDIAYPSSEELMKSEVNETEFSILVSAFFEWKGSQVFCLNTEEIISRIKQDFGQ